MNRSCFIIPYFGKFPEIFPLFLKSTKYNMDYDWIIFTDNEIDFQTMENVKVVLTSFNHIKELVQSKFSFPIVLDTPYKLCDYKCAYGYIFEEYIREYEFWGYCDIDLIFGKISDFIGSEHFDEYDKIGHLGHFSLYKNNADLRMLFTANDFYKTVFTSNKVYVFDEWNEGSINHIAIEQGLKLCMLNSWKDIYPFSSFLSEVLYVFTEKGQLVYKPDGKIHVFVWKDGEILDIALNKGRTSQSSCMYVHFQKRSFFVEKSCINDNTQFICGPRSIKKYKKYNFWGAMAISQLFKIINIKLIKKKSQEILYICRSNLSVMIRGEH